jgi:hypothetical protein
VNRYEDGTNKGGPCPWLVLKAGGRGALGKRILSWAACHRQWPITILMVTIKLDNYYVSVYTMLSIMEVISMRTQGRLTDVEIVDIIDGYTVRLERMIDLATKHGITRQGVFKVLMRAGVNTHKGDGGAAQIHYSCTVCGKEGVKNRANFRKRKHVFCNQDCYTAWLQHGNGNPLIIHRQGARVGRDIAGKYHTFLPGHVLHHEDRNQNNNHISNLKVFATQGDHIRYHRGFTVPILFDGSTI